MADVKIIVIDGVRYREDDAERRGLIKEKAVAVDSDAAEAEKAAAAKKEADAKAAEAAKAKQPANKAATPAAK